VPSDGERQTRPPVNPIAKLVFAHARTAVRPLTLCLFFFSPFLLITARIRFSGGLEVLCSRTEFVEQILPGEGHGQDYSEAILSKGG
jgi:hypothetical protein